MQQAFHEQHGLQCGYCTAGMVMASVSFLEENPNPTERDVRLGLEGNLCRCTGYHNIVKAVLAAAAAAARESRGDRRHRAPRVLGQRTLRKEDPPLLTGEARFVNDLFVPGALHMRLVRSPVAHAKIVAIDTTLATTMPGVIDVITGADLVDDFAAPLPCAWPVTEDMKHPDHWPLARDEVRFVGDGVAVVLAETHGKPRGRGRSGGRRIRGAPGRPRPRGRRGRHEPRPRRSRHEHARTRGRSSRIPTQSIARSRTPHTRSRSATSSSG